MGRPVEGSSSAPLFVSVAEPEPPPPPPPDPLVLPSLPCSYMAGQWRRSSSGQWLTEVWGPGMGNNHVEKLANNWWSLPLFCWQKRNSSRMVCKISKKAFLRLKKVAKSTTKNVVRICNRSFLAWLLKRPLTFPNFGCSFIEPTT